MEETTSPTSNARDILQESNQYLSTARFLMATPPRPTQLAPEKQALLDDLLDQNSEGTISPDDQATLIDLVAEAEQLMVENSEDWLALLKANHLQLLRMPCPLRFGLSRPKRSRKSWGARRVIGNAGTARGRRLRILPFGRVCLRRDIPYRAHCAPVPRG